MSSRFDLRYWVGGVVWGSAVACASQRSDYYIDSQDRYPPDPTHTPSMSLDERRANVRRAVMEDDDENRPIISVVSQQFSVVSSIDHLVRTHMRHSDMTRATLLLAAAITLGGCDSATTAAAPTEPSRIVAEGASTARGSGKAS